jgi:hypothetical protein
MVGTDHFVFWKKVLLGRELILGKAALSIFLRTEASELGSLFGRLQVSEVPVQEDVINDLHAAAKH